MKLKLTILMALALTGVMAATNQTYTVKTPVWETTNAIEVIPDHEHAKPPCTLIRYLQDGKTNEFHAWAVPVQVTTNSIAEVTTNLSVIEDLIFTNIYWGTNKLYKSDQSGKLNEITVQQLCASGEVCAVMGHSFVPMPIPIVVGSDGAVTEHRKCRICGLWQFKTTGDWK